MAGSAFRAGVMARKQLAQLMVVLKRWVAIRKQI
jgi:hypothetical protein